MVLKFEVRDFKNIKRGEFRFPSLWQTLAIEWHNLAIEWQNLATPWQTFAIMKMEGEWPI